MPYKAKLTTRTLSTSTVTTDNLNKGSELTFQQADSNFLNLRDQTIGIAGDDSTTIEVGAGNTLKVAGSGTVTTAVSGQTLTITGSGGIGDLSVIGSTILAPSNGDLGLQTSGTGYVHVKDKLAVAKEIYFDDYGDPAVEPPGNGERMRILDEEIDINYGRQSIDSFRIWSRSGSDSQLYILDVNTTGDSSNLGHFKIYGLSYPSSDGTAGQVLKTDGAGQLSWTNVGIGNGINLVGDDSTGTLFSPGETIKIAGATGITTAVSGDTLTITGTAMPNVFNTIAIAGQSDVVADTSTDTLTLAAGTNITLTTNSTTDTITINAAAASSGNITFDGNNISTINSNEDIVLDPAGTGTIQLRGNLDLNDNVITSSTGGLNVKIDKNIVLSRGTSTSILTTSGNGLKLGSGGDGSSNPGIGIGYDHYNATNTNDISFNMVSTGRIRVVDQNSTQTQTTIGANGAASALTANPVGYLKIKINDSNFVIPYYNI